MHILLHLLLLLLPLFDGTTGKASYVDGLQVGTSFDGFTNYESAGPAFFHSFTNNVCSNCCPNSAQTETGIMQQSQVNQYGQRLAAVIHEYPRRDELEIARQETSKWLENCLEQIGGRNPEMRDFLSYWKDTADAPDTKTKFMIVAIVFIVAFVVALIGMVFFTVLYFSHRK